MMHERGRIESQYWLRSLSNRFDVDDPALSLPSQRLYVCSKYFDDLSLLHFWVYVEKTLDDCSLGLKEHA